MKEKLCFSHFCNYQSKKSKIMYNLFFSLTLFHQGTPHVDRGPFTTAWAWLGSPSSTSTTTAPQAPRLSSWPGRQFWVVSQLGTLESDNSPKNLLLKNFAQQLKAVVSQGIHIGFHWIPIKMAEKKYHNVHRSFCTTIHYLWFNWNCRIHSFEHFLIS